MDSGFAPVPRAPRNDSEDDVAYWLMKSEPDSWSWQQQVKKDAKGEAWSGVRNHQAKLNLMKMKKGDRAFFYHSNVGKAAVGIVEVIRAAYPDPTAKPGEPWMVVDVKAVEPLPKPVSIDDVKKEPKLKHMVLINNTRLSVQPVTPEEWKTVCKMGGL